MDRRRRRRRSKKLRGEESGIEVFDHVNTYLKLRVSTLV
jgi:hypothetical protein